MHHIASLFLPWLHSPHDCVGQPGTYSAHCADNITHEPIAQEMCALLALPSTLNTPQRPQPLYCPTSHIDVRYFFVSRRSTMMGSESIALVTVRAPLTHQSLPPLSSCVTVALRPTFERSGQVIHCMNNPLTIFVSFA